MTDHYTQKQLKNYEQASSEAAQNDALYRLGTHFEIIPCNGDTNLSNEQKESILNAAQNINASTEAKES